MVDPQQYRNVQRIIQTTCAKVCLSTLSRLWWEGKFEWENPVKYHRLSIGGFSIYDNTHYTNDG